jgi:predicted TIM-barrel fold metal-dependent hydrolase
MAIIDADTHVDESDDTWLKMEGSYDRYMPATVAPRPGEAPRPGFDPEQSRWWLFEGILMARAVRDEVHHPPRVRRELEDVPGRLRHMDEMGVDVQVVFPTFFIRHGTSNAEAEWALTSTYNRWVQEKCSATNGRLRWACVLPYLQPEKAIEELRWAKANGACGIFKRGFDLERSISDPYFFPIYEEANALDMPLCIHTGHPFPGRPGNRAFPIISSFLGIVGSGMAKKFPRLRFALIEAGASWIPYTLSQKAAEKRQQMRDQGKVLGLMELMDLNRDLFRTNRVYVTVDPVDDVEYLIKLGLEDSLMIGTDYSHHDISANLNAFDEVRSWANEGRISQAAVQKMFEANPAACYGL